VYKWWIDASFAVHLSMGSHTVQQEVLYPIHVIQTKVKHTEAITIPTTTTNRRVMKDWILPGNTINQSNNSDFEL
jgi:hypothetical protein